MTEFEQQLTENLTKQLDAHNRIEAKKMQNESLWKERLHEAEISQMYEKQRLYKNAADLLLVISTITVLTAILLGMGILSGLGACASIF